MGFVLVLKLSIILFVFLVAYFIIDIWYDIKFIKNNKKDISIQKSWYVKISFFMAIILVLLIFIIFEILLYKSAFKYPKLWDLEEMSVWVFWTLFSIILILGILKFYKYKFVRTIYFMFETDEHILLNQNEFNKYDVQANDKYYLFKNTKYIFKYKIDKKLNLSNLVQNFMNSIILVMIMILFFTGIFLVEEVWDFYSYDFITETTSLNKESYSYIFIWITISLILFNLTYLVTIAIINKYKYKYKYRLIESMLPIAVNIIILFILISCFIAMKEYLKYYKNDKYEIGINLKNLIVWLERDYTRGYGSLYILSIVVLTLNYLFIINNERNKNITW